VSACALTPVIVQSPTAVPAGTACDAEGPCCQLKAITISAELITQHPVALASGVKSKPAARIRGSTIPHRNVGLDVIVGGAVGLNSRLAIRRCGDTRHKVPGAVEKEDAVRSKSLHQAGSLNSFVCLIAHKYAVLSRSGL